MKLVDLRILLETYSRAIERRPGEGAALDRLRRAGLVQRQEGSDRYVATPRGRVLVEELAELLWLVTIDLQRIERGFSMLVVGFAALVEQVRRFRRMKPLPCDDASVAEHVRRETLEFEEAAPDHKREEASDAHAVALNLLLGRCLNDNDLALALRESVGKIRARLDHVARGASWSEAKARARW